MFSSRKTVLIAVGLVMAGGFAFYWWQSEQLKRLSVEPQRIAVLPFANQTADPDLDPVGAALALSLAEQLGGLDRVAAFAVSSPGEAAGRQATLLVHGRIEQDKGRCRLSASLERLARREFDAAGSAAAAKAEIPALLTTIAQGIQSAVRPKGRLAPPEVRSLPAAAALGRSLDAASPAASLSELSAAVGAEPACGLCWRRLVELQLATGNREAAFSQAEASRRAGISPYNSALIELAVAGASNDQPRQLKALERLAQLRPGEDEIQARRGAVLARAARWNEAVDAYRTAVAASPLSPGLWNEFGYVLAWAGHPAEARRALDEYARLDPASANPLDSQGEIALMAGRFEEAIKAFEECYRKDKSFNGGQALEKAALAAYLAGERDRAASYVDRYLSIAGDQTQPRVRLLRASWQYAFGAISSSVTAVDAVSPGMGALLLAAAGDLDGAAARLQSQNSPGAAQVRVLLKPESQWPDAPPGRMDLAVNRGLSESLQRRWPAAAQAFRRILAAAPANTPQAAMIREAAAWALVMDAKPAEAAKLLGPVWPLPLPSGFSELSLLVYPNLFYTRAEIALSEGRRDDARKFYDLFLLYCAERKDPSGIIARARAAARL